MRQKNTQPEPWLRGTLADVPAVPRAVLHALELAAEDLQRWCGPLNEKQLNARPARMASVAFHLLHIAGSIDRLLTYAEGKQLSEAQLLFLKRELEPRTNAKEPFELLRNTLAEATVRIRELAAQDLEQPRAVGKKNLPTTLGGLLVHVADHTQRHVGQAITTAKVVTGG